jgi:hypothetical protein
MSSRPSKLPSPQTAAALNALARAFWQAATVVVEKRMDAEDAKPKVQRVKLTRVHVSRFTTSTAQMPRAAGEP